MKQAHYEIGAKSKMSVPYATYASERGRSLGAEDAEDRGLLPLTRAIRPLAQTLKITQKEARKRLVNAGPAEWHHTGNRARRTNYYDWHALLPEEVRLQLEKEEEEKRAREEEEGRKYMEERARRQAEIDEKRARQRAEIDEIKATWRKTEGADAYRRYEAALQLCDVVKAEHKMLREKYSVATQRYRRVYRRRSRGTISREEFLAEQNLYQQIETAWKGRDTDPRWEEARSAIQAFLVAEQNAVDAFRKEE